MPPVSCSVLPFIMRETYADWTSPTGTITLQNSSLDLRPGAVTQDYKAAFSYGPTEVGNLISGSINRVWRARAVSASLSSSVVISNEISGGFSPEAPLFTFVHGTSGTISELDIGFGSDGRPVIAAQRNADSGVPAVWLYWFNPFVANFVFQQFQTQSITPRIILDNPEDIGNSDLLLFYVNRTNGQVYYRQQRDQYGTEYVVPTPGSVNLTGQVTSNSITFLSGSAFLRGSGSGSVTSANMVGQFIGSGSNISGTGTASLSTETSTSLAFTGTINGQYNGVFSGSYNNGFTVVSGSALSGSFFGFLSGAFSASNSITGVITRTQIGSFGPITNGWGSFRATASANLLTGSFIVTGSNFLSGQALLSSWSGSATGNFAVEYTNGTISGSTTQFQEIYLEDAVKLRDSRIAVFYSKRDALTDQWQIGRYETVLYPFFGDFDRLTTDLSFVTASVREVLLSFIKTGSLVTEQFIFNSASVSIASASIRNVLINYARTGSFATEAFIFNTGSISIFSGSIRDIIINHTMSRQDVFTTASIALTTGSLNTVVLEHNLFFQDVFTTASIALVSGSLI